MGRDEGKGDCNDHDPERVGQSIIKINVRIVNNYNYSLPWTLDIKIYVRKCERTWRRDIVTMGF